MSNNQKNETESVLHKNFDLPLKSELELKQMNEFLEKKENYEHAVSSTK